MAGRSYLRRIAQPLVPGAPQLSLLPSPLAHEARPPAMRSARRHTVTEATGAKTPPSRKPIAPAAFLAGLEALHPAAAATEPPVTPHADLTGPIRLEPEAGAVPAHPLIARPPTARPQTQRDSRIRSAPTSTIEQDRVGGAAALLDPMPGDRPMVEAWRAPQALPNLHIGTVEVRTRPAPAPVPTPAPARVQRGAPAVPQSPLSRGLAWRYGLVQG